MERMVTGRTLAWSRGLASWDQIPLFHIQRIAFAGAQRGRERGSGKRTMENSLQPGVPIVSPLWVNYYRTLHDRHYERMTASSKYFGHSQHILFLSAKRLSPCMIFLSILSLAVPVPLALFR